MGLLVQGVCASKTTFEKMSLRGGGSYPERQYILMDYEMTGGLNEIIMSPEGISECISDYINDPEDLCYSRYWYSTRSDLVLDRAGPEIESAGLFLPDGPFFSLGYDYKMVIRAGIYYNQHDCRDEILKMYEIIQKSALEEGYNNTAVIFNKGYIMLD